MSIAYINSEMLFKNNVIEFILPISIAMQILNITSSYYFKRSYWQAIILNKVTELVIPIAVIVKVLLVKIVKGFSLFTAVVESELPILITVLVLFLFLRSGVIYFLKTKMWKTVELFLYWGGAFEIRIKYIYWKKKC